MRISELARLGGVSVATVKFYLREGLLPRGVPGGRTQAAYDERHLRRLRLIRALRNVGGLDGQAILRVTRAIDDATVPRHELFGLATRGIAGPPPGDAEGDADHADHAEAQRRVDALLDELGWRVSADAPAKRVLARAVEALDALGRPADPARLRRYGDMADRLAAWEVGAIPETASRGEAVEAVVVGTVVYEAVFAALRRLAHEHHSGRRKDPT